jgi:hypothetical protein
VKRLAWIALAATAALVASATPAAAKEGIGGDPPQFGENAPRNYESSQWFNFEIKFGPYSPNIDASPSISKLDRTPFADIFPTGGAGKRPPGKLLTQLELDFQFLHKWYGNFGIGHTIGYYRRNSHALEYADSTTQEPCVNTATNKCTPSPGDTTSLNIIPLSLLFVYRFDYLAHRYKIPFVPYFKVGLAYYAWWIENGGGFLSIAQYEKKDATGKVIEHDSGFGGTWGFVLNPGGAFLLDVLDPSAARTLDAELGINHTYLFCELHYANITGFGSQSAMNLSDLTLNAGISFEF